MKKESMPTDKILDAKEFVEEVLIPYNKAHCNFVLNAAPNRDGLLDDNAMAELKKIDQLWNETAQGKSMKFNFP